MPALFMLRREEQYLMKYIDALVERYPQLSAVKEDAEELCRALIKCFSSGGKLLVCGNGGSSADAEHIAGELMKGFLKKRELSKEKRARMLGQYPRLGEEILDSLQQGLPVIPLGLCAPLSTAFANDCNPKFIFAQEVLAYGGMNDVFLGISTSGNSENVCAAAEVARSLGLFSCALTGGTGGRLRDICDSVLAVPETETFKIQELHLPVYHAICAEVEEYFFNNC